MPTPDPAHLSWPRTLLALLIRLGPVLTSALLYFVTRHWMLNGGGLLGAALTMLFALLTLACSVQFWTSV